MSSSIQTEPESFMLEPRTIHHRNVQPSDSVSESTAIQIPQSGPIAQATHTWFEIQQKLPPQITRRNIQMISVGGVIGTGLFLGMHFAVPQGWWTGRDADRIHNNGEYCVCRGHIFGRDGGFFVEPHVGGPVGLADVYVDQALGFAMGWNAWYNWSIVLPAELSASSIIASFYVPAMADTERYNSIVKKLSYGTTSVLLVSAVAINFLGKYGQYEFYFSTIKVFTIVALIIIGIVIDNLQLKTANIIPPELLSCIPRVFDPTVTKMNIGLKYLTCPGAFVQYKGIPGVTGKILGIWSVLMQAIFSYCGSEIPAIAGAEVENPRKNIPSAVKRIWIRIFLFYVLGVFVAGLLVPYNHPNLSPKDSNNGTQYVQSSPFIIAMQATGIKFLPQITSALFILSAWSAATSDVYISSRFMYFLAKRDHAPRFLATLVSMQKVGIQSARSPCRRNAESESPAAKPAVVPVFGILAATVFAFLAFLPSQSPSAEQAFYWLSSMTAAAAMLSWIGMMVTYIRWHAGIKHAEAQDPINFKKDHPELYNRSVLQPFLAWYAIIMCIAILLLHGW
ncbi:hypothetical protein PILCRDRAFT_7206 [Piloderma croceum F 1598]|uniref:Amino acid permease/ SLC12A domain-containing protein n=1 Tax=Piloderma croceum (strain F 1598) TaxID=765440 RepID=A0A0C3FUY2_PILCF|nr:hypothetical protein PILCRDRAFT_7206 [Piloderma croceum F 1598]